MNVLFLLTNPIESPGERYRVLQYLPRLQQHGINPSVDVLLTGDTYRKLQSGRSRIAVASRIAASAARRTRDLSRLAGVDLVVMYRQPVGLAPGSVERLLARRRVPYLFDFDDAIFLPPPSPVSKVSGFLRPPQRVAPLIHGAAMTTPGNDYLADFAVRHSDRVRVVPTTIDTDRYMPRRRPSRERLVVGWMGSRSTAQYLHGLDEVWRRLDRRRFVLRVVGGQYEHPDVDVDLRPWSLQTEVSEVADFDIGIMPLPDDPWTRGKCGLKILQYMAAGVPTVAAPVGVNGSIIAHGENGLLAGTADAWATELSRLFSDEELREGLGASGRHTVVESYSLERWAPQLAQLLREAVA